MTAEQTITDFLIRSAHRAFCDDCLSKGLAIQPRQQVHQKTFALAKSTRFVRDKGRCDRCGSEKLVIWAKAAFEIGTPADLI